MNTKTYKLIYITDGGICTMLFRWFGDTMFEEGGKRHDRELRIDETGCYPRLMHVYKNRSMHTLGQYPSTDLGRDWSESLQDKFAKELREVRGEFVFVEEVATSAVKTMAEQIVAMVQADYPNDLEMQRGIAGDYLGDTVQMVQDQIHELLKD